MLNGLTHPRDPLASGRGPLFAARKRAEVVCTLFPPQAKRGWSSVG